MTDALSSSLDNPFAQDAGLGLAWAAGLFEGEGSVCACRAGKNSSYYALRVQIGMTDKDVLDRFCEIIGVGKVRGPYDKNGKKSRSPLHKPVYFWTVGRRHQQIEVINKLWPFLCERRRSQIIEAHSKIKPIEFPTKGIHDGDRTGRWLEAV